MLVCPVGHAGLHTTTTTATSPWSCSSHSTHMTAWQHRRTTAWQPQPQQRWDNRDQPVAPSRGQIMSCNAGNIGPCHNPWRWAYSFTIGGGDSTLRKSVSTVWELRGCYYSKQCAMNELGEKEDVGIKFQREVYDRRESKVGKGGCARQVWCHGLVIGTSAVQGVMYKACGAGVDARHEAGACRVSSGESPSGQ